MMKARTIAEAVATVIDGGSYSYSVDEAVVAWVPNANLFELDSIRVVVVPGEIETSQVARSTFERNIIVNVGIQRKVSNDSEISEVAELAGEFDDRLWSVPIDVNYVRLVSTKFEPLVAVEQINEISVCTSILKATYKVMET